MRVFLSYNARDSEFADEFRRHLANEQIRVWDPAHELLPGSNWLLQTGKAFERADAVVFLLSKDSTASPTLRREVEYVISNEKFADRVIPVLLENNLDNVPWILMKMNVVNAADGDAKRAASQVAQALRPPVKVKFRPPRRLSLKREASKTPAQKTKRR